MAKTRCRSGTRSMCRTRNGTLFPRRGKCPTGSRKTCVSPRRTSTRRRVSSGRRTSARRTSTRRTSARRTSGRRTSGRRRVSSARRTVARRSSSVRRKSAPCPQNTYSVCRSSHTGALRSRHGKCPDGWQRECLDDEDLLEDGYVRTGAREWGSSPRRMHTLSRQSGLRSYNRSPSRMVQALKTRARTGSESVTRTSSPSETRSTMSVTTKPGTTKRFVTHTTRRTS